jgi:bifunctional DNA-binding transcriptional regulator/antitoxin component of YhaV-PrlF toxin-antitoxin module
MQHCSMTAIPVSKRGTVTLPPEVRRKLRLESVPHPMLLVELREDGVFLHPATAVPVRDIPLKQMQKWIKDDEKDAEKFWKKEKSSR